MNGIMVKKAVQVVFDVASVVTVAKSTSSIIDGASHDWIHKSAKENDEEGVQKKKECVGAVKHFAMPIAVIGYAGTVLKGHGIQKLVTNIAKTAL